MALINCPECGKEVSDNSTFCPNCGNEIHNQNYNKKIILYHKQYLKNLIVFVTCAIFAVVCFNIGQSNRVQIPVQDRLISISEQLVENPFLWNANAEQEKLNDYKIERVKIISMTVIGYTLCGFFILAGTYSAYKTVKLVKKTR